MADEQACVESFTYSINIIAIKIEPCGTPILDDGNRNFLENLNEDSSTYNAFKIRYMVETQNDIYPTAEYQISFIDIKYFYSFMMNALPNLKFFSWTTRPTSKEAEWGSFVR